MKNFNIFVCAPLFLIATMASSSAIAGLRVLAFGDAGSCSTSTPDPTTCIQNTVANSMKSVCDVKGCDMGIMLGDNIYNLGTTNNISSKFDTKFNAHYSQLQIPIYVSLGNHDISLNRTNGSGNTLSSTARQNLVDAQVSHQDTNLSGVDAWKSQWRMGASLSSSHEYYDFVKDDVHFFVVNSNNFSMDGAPYDSEQADWLEDGLKSSEANWKVVYGHHPIHSVGQHGNDAELRDYANSVGPIICKYADLFVSGHDHDLQLLDSDCGVPLVISGAAGKKRSLKSDSSSEPLKRWAQGDIYGFAHIEFHDHKFVIDYYLGTSLEGHSSIDSVREDDGSRVLVGGQALLHSRNYYREYRLQLRNSSSSFSSRKTLHVEHVHSIDAGEQASVTTLPIQDGENLWHSAVWSIERYKQYLRFKNRWTGEYLHIENGGIETDSAGTANGGGVDISKWWSAQWELIIPDSPSTSSMSIRNRWKKTKFLSVNSSNKLVLKEFAKDSNGNYTYPNANDSTTNWIMSPVDWHRYD